MTETIGNHHVDSDGQRAVLVEVNNTEVEILANRFGDTWGVGQRLPYPRGTYKADDLEQMFESFLEQIEALRMRGYTLDETDGEFAFWSKEVEEKT